jgi:hypothetical protein
MKLTLYAGFKSMCYAVRGARRARFEPGAGQPKAAVNDQVPASPRNQVFNAQRESATIERPTSNVEP